MFFTRHNAESLKPLDIFSLHCPTRVTRLQTLKTYQSHVIDTVGASDTVSLSALNGDQTEQLIRFIIQLTNFYKPDNTIDDGFFELYKSHKDVRDFITKAFDKDKNSDRIIEFMSRYNKFLQHKVVGYSQSMRSFYKKSGDDNLSKKQILNKQSELLSAIIQPIQLFSQSNHHLLAHSPLLSRASVFFVDLLCDICSSDEVIDKISEDKPDLIFESLQYFLSLRVIKIFVDDEKCQFEGLFKIFLHNTLVILRDSKLDLEKTPPRYSIEHLIPELVHDVLSNLDFIKVCDRYHIESFPQQSAFTLNS